MRPEQTCQKVSHWPVNIKSAEPQLVIRELGRNEIVPKEREVWNIQGGRKEKLFYFFPLHSLGLYNNNVSCLRTVFGLNLLANSVILKHKLWE